MDPGAGHRVVLAGGGTLSADAVYVVATPPAGPAATFAWTPTVPASGAYAVYAKWPADAARPTAASYTVTHAGGSTQLTVNQRRNGGTWHPLGSFTFDPGQGHGVTLDSSTAGEVAADAIRLVAADAAPANVAYVHADHLGTPQKLSDPAGALVWDRQALPFGATSAVAGPQSLPLRFPGQYADAETGLYYNYFRDYDATLGRYLQSDPIGLAGGLNTYAYVGGNPLRWVDPFGLTEQDIARALSLARRTQTNLNVPGQVQIDDLGSIIFGRDFTGYTDPLTKSITIDDQFLPQLTCHEFVDLFRTVVHEAIHRSGPRSDMISRPKTHDDIYKEADDRTKAMEQRIRQLCTCPMDSRPPSYPLPYSLRADGTASPIRRLPEEIPGGGQ